MQEGLFKLIFERFEAGWYPALERLLMPFRNQKIDFKPVISNLKLFLDKLQTARISPLSQLQFMGLYLRYSCGDGGPIPWDQIRPFPDTFYFKHAALDSCYAQAGAAAMDQLAVIKLNGGLGTTMGCSGPKSTIKIYQNDTFLDVIAKQILACRSRFGARLPLVMMNSFNTHAETHKILSKRLDHISFLQNQFPRIARATGAPFEDQKEPHQEWYPPGHGDLFFSILSSGVLDQLLAQGIRYAFVSNADNLGAVPDAALLGLMVLEKLPFLMEVAAKTVQDVKGGTLIQYHNKPTLLERAQVEKEHLGDFEEISVFNVFNTNTLWLDLAAIKQRLTAYDLDLPLIVNCKQVDGRDVVQLETAMGAAIALFDFARAVLVARDRFLPVKKTSDLMVLQSDYIEKTADGFMRFSPDAVQACYPNITLDQPYQTMAGYQRLVTAAPSLIKCRSLIINGEIELGEGVVFEGDVVLEK